MKVNFMGLTEQGLQRNLGIFAVLFISKIDSARHNSWKQARTYRGQGGSAPPDEKFCMVLPPPTESVTRIFI